MWASLPGRVIGSGTRRPNAPAGSMALGGKGEYGSASKGTAYTGQGPENVSEVEPLFDETGLPTRLPRNAREAMLFQLQSSRSARQLQARQQAAAMSTMQYGLGMAQFQSPYGLGALMSPLLGQMAQTQASLQYAPSDWSYFLRPEAHGEAPSATGGYRGGRRLSGTVRAGPTNMLSFQMPAEPAPRNPWAAQPAAAAAVPAFDFDPLGNVPGPQLEAMEPAQPLLDMPDPMADLGGEWI